MDRFTLQIDLELKLMSEYDLTAEELFLTYLIFLAQEPEDKQEYLNEYIRINQNHGGGIREELLDSLNNKGVIKKIIKRKGEGISIDDIQFNSNFLKKYLKNTCELAQDLISHYPKHIYISGMSVDSMSSNNKFGSFQDMMHSYARIIKNNPKIHDAIIELIEYGKSNNLINYTIGSFIADQRWIGLKNHRELGHGSIDNFEMGN